MKESLKLSDNPKWSAVRVDGFGTLGNVSTKNWKDNENP